MSAIICDIDGTLLAGANGIKKTIEYINSQASRYDINIVTGRPESERGNTTKALKANGVKYNRLIMNPHSSANSYQYKHDTAKALQAKQKIVLAIDNDAKARSAYASLQIKTMNPRNLPSPSTKE